MTAYKIYHDDTIEAKTASDAEETLKGMTGPAKMTTYYLDEKIARSEFARIAATLAPPKELGSYGLRWYDGVILASADVSNVDWEDAVANRPSDGSLDDTIGAEMFAAAVVEDIVDLRVRALTFREQRVEK